MTKHRWKESIKSFFGHHIAHEKSQEMENTKNGIKNKVAKMLRIIKEEENEETGPPGSFNKQSELVDLIEDVHEQYQSLYTHYSDLIGELRDKVHSREEKNGHSSSSSSSDSDSDHSRDKADEKKKQNGEHQKLLEKLKLELEALDQKFRAAEKDNEALKSEHFLALSKIEKTEKKIEELQTKAEELEDERLKVWVENGKMTLDLEAARNLEVELRQKLKDADIENETLKGENLMNLSRIAEQTKVIEALKAEADILKEEKCKLWVENGATKLEMESLKQQVLDLNQRLNSAVLEEDNATSSRIASLSTEIDQAQKTIMELTTETKQLKDMLDAREAELSKLHSERQESEHVSSARINILESEVTELKLEKDSFTNLKREYEGLIESRTNDAKALSEENLRLQQLQSELQHQISESERMSKERIDELSGLLQKAEEDKDGALIQLRIMTEKFNDQQMELESLRAQLVELKEQELHLTTEVDECKLKLGSLRAEKIELEESIKSKSHEALKLQQENMQLVQYKMKNQEQILDLEGQLKVRIDELSSLHKRLDDRENDASTQIKDLNVKLNDLQQELDSLRAQKNELEEQMASKDHEIKQLTEESLGLKLVVAGLQEKILDLESTLKLSEDSVSSLRDSENRSSSKIEDLMTQVATMQLELESILAQRIQLEQEIQVRNQEVSDYLMQMQSLNSELDSLRSEKSRLEEEKKIEFLKAEKFLEEKSGLGQAVVELQDKILNLETLSKKKEDESLAIAKKLEDVENSSSIQIKQLTEDAKNLQLELEVLQNQKCELELQNEQISENLTRIENVNLDMTSKIEAQETMLKELQDSFHKLNEEYKQLDARFEKSKEDLHAVEQRMKEREEQLQAELKSKDEQILVLQEKHASLGKVIDTIQGEVDNLRLKLNKHEEDHREIGEELQRVEEEKLRMNEEKNGLLQSKDKTIERMEAMLEEAQEEIRRLREEVNSIEVRLRLANTKLQMTEQLLMEKEDSHKQVEERFLLENKYLKEQIGGLSEQVISAKEIMVRTDHALAELEPVFQKYDKDQVSFSKRILHVSGELQVARKWVSGMKFESHELKKDASNLVKELGEYKELGSAQMQKIEKLEMMMNELQMEKDGHLKIISGLEKRTIELERRMKDIQLAVVDREEEKREAIRQLCLWIDYHRENFDYVKELLLKMSKRNQRGT